ncbi:MAG: hypothetical protein ACYDGN_04550 [Acidimicrobiales bacterium]
MSKGQATSPVLAPIRRLLAAQDTVTSGDVARAAGVSRQAAHYRLRAMAERGELLHEGAGRGSRFRRSAFLSYQYDIAGLSEDRVWAEEDAELRRGALQILDNPRIRPLRNFVLTEMVNNAIDHSRGSALDVRWYFTDAYIAFDVDDDGARGAQRVRHLLLVANGQSVRAHKRPPLLDRRRTARRRSRRVARIGPTRDVGAL